MALVLKSCPQLPAAGTFILEGLRLEHAAAIPPPTLEFSIRDVRTIDTVLDDLIVVVLHGNQAIMLAGK